jgi:hypothetical protein
MVEVKWRDGNLSSNFNYFKKFFPPLKMTQVSKYLAREKTFPNGAEIRTASKWLANVELP